MNAAWSPHGGGSGKLAREERGRLIDSFTKVVGERGFTGIGPDDVVRESGLPREAFERHFDDLRQCLIAAYDAFCERLVAEIEDAMDPAASWPEQLAAGIHAAIHFVMESAAIARVFAVDGLALGPPVINRYTAAIERVVVLLRLGRTRSAVAAELPPLSEAVLVAGAFALVTDALLAEEQAQLPLLEAELTRVFLAHYREPAAAV